LKDVGIFSTASYIVYIKLEYILLYNMCVINCLIALYM
jgi:hypothetical protein